MSASAVAVIVPSAAAIFVRNLLLSAGGAREEMLAVSPEDLPAIRALAERFSYADLLRIANLLLRDDTPEAVRQELKTMGYTLTFEPLTSGPINAIYFDSGHGTFWGGSSNYGEDYGIAW